MFGRPRPSQLSALSLSFSLLLLGPRVHADDTVAAAQLLFEQGRDLLRAGQFAEACPRLSESQRLDPATGTLLALAMCHEGEGKLASAWAEFSGVVSLARRDGHLEREQLARQRASALKPRLSTIELRVPERASETPGFELRRNGLLLGKDSFNLPIPVDGGSYEIIASAPNTQSWKTRLVVRAESDAALVLVPVLAPAPSEAVANTTPATERPAAPSTHAASTRSAAPPANTSDAQPRGYSSWQWAGIATAGVGVASLAVGGYFMLEALDRYKQGASDCPAGACDPEGEGYGLQQTGVRYGNYATALGVGGAVLAATGAVLFLWGDTSATKTQDVALRVTPERLGAHYQYRF